MAQNTVLRWRIGIAEQGPLPNQLGGGTKKVLWTFFARALNPKSEEEIETASTDFCLSAQWLIGTTPTYGTRTS